MWYCSCRPVFDAVLFVLIQNTLMSCTLTMRSESSGNYLKFICMLLGKRLRGNVRGSVARSPPSHETYNFWDIASDCVVDKTDKACMPSAFWVCGSSFKFSLTVTRSHISSPVLLDFIYKNYALTIIHFERRFLES